jgi:polyhydroxybutyrate depolymerase
MITKNCRYTVPKTVLLLLISVLWPVCRSEAAVSTATLEFDGLTRGYSYYVPTNLTHGVEVPLVYVLHGGGSNSSQMVLQTNGEFNLLANSNGFIVVYPDAYTVRQSLGQVWNDARKEDPINRGIDGINDVGFINALNNQIKTTYSIDSSRIYAAGFSSGGMMASRLGMEMPDVFAAVALISSPLPVTLEISGPKQPISVLYMQGTEDPNAPYNGGNLKSLGTTVLSAADTVKYWTDYNHTDTIPVTENLPDVVTTDGYSAADPNVTDSTITKYTYSHGLNGTEVEFYSINGAGHTWPGGLQSSNSTLGAINMDINAADEIYGFFSDHSLGIPENSCLSSLLFSFFILVALSSWRLKRKNGCRER